MATLPHPTQDDIDRLLHVVRRRRKLAKAVLLFELVWPALWPAAGVTGVLLCAALLDLPGLLPPWLHLVLLVGVLAGIGFLLARGLSRVDRPGIVDADRRLEAVSGLRHRPLSVLTDRPALPGAESLWRAHVARAVAQIGRLRVGFPHPGMAALDPMALRGGLIVALVACFGIAGAEAPARIGHALWPRFAPPQPVPAPQLQAWITPPSYTGLPPVFLKADSGTVTVPAGSHLTANLTGGGTDAPVLAMNGKDLPFARLDASSFQADADLTTGGRLAVRRQGRDMAAWDMAVTADVAPEVHFPEPPGVARRAGRVPPTRLPWEVAHAYGVTSLQAELRLRDRPDAAPLIVSIPLPGGNPKHAKGARLQDLTAHPWAGLAVTAQLVARDAPGLMGISENATFQLPERRFDNKVAQALMAARKQLTLKPDDRWPVIGQLDQLSAISDIWDNDTAGFLNLRAIASELHRDRRPEAVEDAQARMWQLALHLEEGAPERTAQALAEARRDLHEALEAQKRGDKIDPGEIDRKIQALERALRQHMEALAEQARRDPDAQTSDSDAQRPNAQDLQKLTEEMRDAERAGDADTAREKMAELEKMLDALQAARPSKGKQDHQRAEKRQRGEQQMGALQDMVQREGGILDHAQGRTPPDDVPRSPADRPPADADTPDAAPKSPDPRQTDALVQQALRRALGELMQEYGDLTGQVPPNLGEADQAMRDGAQALNQGRDQDAAGAAQRAIEALQKGGRSMQQQLSMQFGQSGDDQADGQQGDEGDQAGEDGQDGPDGPGMGSGDTSGGHGRAHGSRPGNRKFSDRNGDIRRDPLGRPLKEGTSGTDDASDVQVPDQMEEGRTRAIQDELRRRGADRGRPQPELDYIDRLLKQF